MSGNESTGSLSDSVEETNPHEDLDFDEGSVSEDGEVTDDEETPASNSQVKQEDGEVIDDAVVAPNQTVDYDSVEEGEVTDEDISELDRKDNKPVCRFFNKGQCTWGNNCRFLHPGVTDKGLYSMFDNVALRNPPPIEQVHHVRVPSSGVESSWERGLRHAKEIIKASAKRKETDVDFEEKKINLSLAGDEDIDKENTHYVRKPSVVSEEQHSFEPEKMSTDLLRVVRPSKPHDYHDSSPPRKRMVRESELKHMISHNKINKDLKRYDRSLSKDSSSSSSSSSSSTTKSSRNKPRYYSEEDSRSRKRKRSVSTNSSSNRKPRRRSSNSSNSSRRSNKSRSSSFDSSSSSRSKSPVQTFVRKAPPRHTMRIAPPLPQFEQQEPPPNPPPPRWNSNPQQNYRNRYFQKRTTGLVRERDLPSQYVDDGGEKKQQEASKGVGVQDKSPGRNISPRAKTRYKRDYSSDHGSISRSRSRSYSSGSEPNYKRNRSFSSSSSGSSHHHRNSSSPENRLKAKSPPVVGLGRASSSSSSSRSNKNASKPKQNQIKLTLKTPNVRTVSKHVIERLGGADDDDKINNQSGPESCGEEDGARGPNRREELLKQLKAVEEAIAKKRSKLDK